MRMYSRKGMLLNAAVKSALREYEARPEQYAKDRAWRNALHLADLAPGWMVCRYRCHKFDKPAEITRVGQRGAQYGRVHYRTREPGRVTQLRRAP